VHDLAGFDEAGWWRPIVCTGRGKHPLHFFGVIFQGPNGLAWSLGPMQGSLDDVGIHRTKIWVTDDTTEAEAEEVRRLRGHGSMNVRCPHGCTPRIPRDAWNQMVEAVRRVEPAWADVSMYDQP